LSTAGGFDLLKTAESAGDRVKLAHREFLEETVHADRAGR
jgi:hypothetical protein